MHRVLLVLKVLLDQVLKETQVLRVLEVQVEHLVLKEPLELKDVMRALVLGLLQRQQASARKLVHRPPVCRTRQGSKTKHWQTTNRTPARSAHGLGCCLHGAWQLEPWCELAEQTKPACST